MSTIAQGSVVVQRVRQGDTITTRLESDLALYQGIADGGGTPFPDWTVSANQPTITPHITTSLHDGEVPIAGGSAAWFYNLEQLTFNSGTGICTGTTGGTNGQNLFHLDFTTGALKIIGNLASAQNTNVDHLRFEAIVDTGYVTKIGADIDVRIELIGKNSYTGIVNTTSKTLKEDTMNSITATAILYQGLASVTTFKTEWLKNNVSFKSKSTDKTCTITRSDVNGSEVFSCNFYVTVDGVDKLVSEYMFIIYDSSDPYLVDLLPVTNSTITDATPNVDIKAILRKRSDWSDITTGSTWAFQAYNCRAEVITLATAVATTNGYKIVRVTSADTDRIESGKTIENGDITIEATATF